MTHLCNDYGDSPACARDADERYTMNYTDVEGGGMIYWCSKCGPLAKAMESKIIEAFATRPGFAQEFEATIADAEAQLVKS